MRLIPVIGAVLALSACGDPLAGVDRLADVDVADTNAAAAALPDAEVVARLTAITGIGRWTAQVYALQALGRADVFPYGDLALQEAARQVFHLPKRPSEEEMCTLAEN